MYASFSLADFDVQAPCLDEEGTVDVRFQTRDETMLSGPVQDVLSLDLPGSHEVRTTAIGWSGGFLPQGDQSAEGLLYDCSGATEELEYALIWDLDPGSRVELSEPY